MEGVVILSNNKPLVATHFVNPRIADLAIDAFLGAKRASGSSSKTSKNTVPPVLWYESFEGPSRSTSTDERNGDVKGKGKSRSRTTYRTSYSEDDDGSSEEGEDSTEEDEEDGMDQRDAYTSIGMQQVDPWAPSTSRSALESAGGTAGTDARHTGGSAHACCHIEHNRLNFLVPISKETDPAVAFSYLYSLLSVLKNYLNDDVTDGSLRDNFDVVLQLLEETFVRPYPISTDASALQDLVPSSNIFNRLLTAGLAAASQTAASSSVSSLLQSGSTGPSPFSSQLHWRRAGIRHAQNEIYFDVREDIHAVLDKNGAVVTGSVFGRIDCRSKLSGMPDITLSLSNPSMLEDLSFHPCVRLGKWVNSKVVSFVPPDGEFELLGYRLSNQSGLLRAKTSTQSNLDIPVPIRVRPVVTLGEVGGSFSISLSPPTTFAPGGVTRLEDVLVTLHLGSNACNVTAGISSATSNSSMSRLSSGRVGSGGSSGSTSADKIPLSGIWEFDTITSTLKWRIPKFSTGSAPTLSGTWTFEDPSGKRTPSPYVNVTFKAALTNISGLGIVNLKMDGEKYSVYKGLRSHLTGSVEARW